MTVVPDTIEPYTGWKTLAAHEGQLTSPIYTTFWPARQRLEARCERNHDYTLSEHPPGEPLPPNPIAVHFVPPHTGIVLNYPMFRIDYHQYSNGSDEPVRLVLRARDNVQPVVDEHCTCGIYVADIYEDSIDYLRGSSPARLLVKVALWGRVIQGEKGARGQYAYPQHLYCHPHDAETAAQLADSYQIPWNISPLLVMLDHEAVH